MPDIFGKALEIVLLYKIEAAFDTLQGISYALAAIKNSRANSITNLASSSLTNVPHNEHIKGF